MAKHAADRAAEIFEGFHRYDAKQVGEFPFSIPLELEEAGPAVWVTYRSDKWNDGMHDYIHKISSFPHVKVGLAGRGGKRVRVPARIRHENQVLVRLGKCLGWAFLDGAGQEIEARSSRGCEWYWSPSGKALVAVEAKRKLVAILWGGRLNVEPRGIVG